MALLSPACFNFFLGGGSQFYYQISSSCANVELHINMLASALKDWVVVVESEFSDRLIIQKRNVWEILSLRSKENLPGKLLTLLVNIQFESVSIVI